MSAIHRSRRVVVPLLLGGLLLLGACHKDEGPERLARAEAKYAELVERGVTPGDPAWDGVIAELESVPRDSKARPEAERRIARIKELQVTRLPPRPLARPDEEDGGSPSLDEHGHPMEPHEHPK